MMKNKITTSEWLEAIQSVQDITMPEGSKSTEELCRELGMTDTTMRRYIKKLIASGKAKLAGKARHTNYYMLT